MTEGLLTTKEASKFLELSPNTLNVYRNRGIGPKCSFDMVSKKYLYNFSDLEDYKNNKDKSTGKAITIYSDVIDNLSYKLGLSIYKNELSGEIIVGNQRLDDNYISYLLVELIQKCGMRIKDKDLIHALNHYTRTYTKHPILDKLKKIKWDNQERLQTWLIDYFQCEASDYIREISQLILIAGIRRLKSPGCKYELMPIFEGPQGNGKSTALTYLALEQDWYGSDCPLHKGSKEVIELCSGKWIVEVSELSSFKRSDAENLKAMLSKQIDEARLAYGRMTIQKPRQFTLIGTTNKKRYLIDDTGNRRFMPIECNHRILIDEFKAIAHQLWAEALIKEKDLYPNGLWLPENLWKEAQARCNLRLQKDPWIDLIASKLPADPDGYLTQNCLLSAIFIEAKNQNPWTSQRLSEVMNILEWKMKEIPLNGGNALTAYSKNDNFSNEICLTEG